MIPVRVSVDAKPTVASGRRMILEPDHPLYHGVCTVCNRTLGGPDPGRTVILILAGIAPEDRKPSGYTTGSAIAVHTRCAGFPDAA